MFLRLYSHFGSTNTDRECLCGWPCCSVSRATPESSTGYFGTLSLSFSRSLSLSLSLPFSLSPLGLSQRHADSSSLAGGVTASVSYSAGLDADGISLSFFLSFSLSLSPSPSLLLSACVWVLMCVYRALKAMTAPLSLVSLNHSRLTSKLPRANAEQAGAIFRLSLTSVRGWCVDTPSLVHIV